MNIIFGTAGFAKEVEWLTQEMFEAGKCDLRPHYFVGEDGNPLNGGKQGETPVISESDFFERFTAEAGQAIIAVGSPSLKSKIALAIAKRAPRFEFPNLVAPSAQFDKRPGRVSIGKGAIICAGTVLTTDIVLGEFVHLNLNTTVGHDCRIGDYVTVSPGVHISGNVHLGEFAFLGTGAAVLERKNICSEAVIGANATVSRDITEPGTYVGTPAKRIK